MRSIFQPGFGVPPTSIASSRRRRSGDWDIPIHCLQKRPIWYGSGKQVLYGIQDGRVGIKQNLSLPFLLQRISDEKGVWKCRGGNK